MDGGATDRYCREAERQTAITLHKQRRGRCCHGNERLFRSISSSSLSAAHALLPSFTTGFLIDDKAIYVSLIPRPPPPRSPSSPRLPPSSPLPRSPIVIYAFSVLFCFRLHFLSSLIFNLHRCFLPSLSSSALLTSQLFFPPLSLSCCLTSFSL